MLGKCLLLVWFEIGRTICGALHKSASDGAGQGDAEACFSAVRALSGAKRHAEASIKLVDGSLATSSQSRDLRWQEHFASVFCGEIVECPGETAGAGRDVGFVSSVSETFGAIRAHKNW